MASGSRAFAFTASLIAAVFASTILRAAEPVATVEIVNSSVRTLIFRASSGFQGRFETPLPETLAQGERSHAELRAGFPGSQGGGFRYGAPGAGECDFGFLRLRGAGGEWLPPTVRASGSGGANCRAEVTAMERGGGFSVRFTIE
ncbi:MAG: hypothetical protein EA385_12955 [Salinarimonadaceae bacterium]|nr:MAG: hypothetical protein EA385_12955 [Salinarimonadaceae bacterium]